MNEKKIATIEFLGFFSLCAWLLFNQPKTGGLNGRYIYLIIWFAFTIGVRLLGKFFGVEAFKSSMPERGLTKIKEGWLFFLPSVAISLLLMFSAYQLGTLDSTPQIPPLAYAFLVILQQSGMIYAIRRLAIMFELKTALLIAPILFGGFHWPNYYMVLITLVGGFWFSWLYFRFRNFYLLCASHFVLGLALSCSFYWELGNMLVGNAYTHRENTILHLRHLR